MNVNAEAIKARQARDKAALELAAVTERFNKAKDALTDLTTTSKPRSDEEVAKVGTEYAKALLAYNAAKSIYLSTREKRPRAPKPATA